MANDAIQATATPKPNRLASRIPTNRGANHGLRERGIRHILSTTHTSHSQLQAKHAHTDLESRREPGEVAETRRMSIREVLLPSQHPRQQQRVRAGDDRDERERDRDGQRTLPGLRAPHQGLSQQHRRRRGHSVHH